jgi:hypothetical protein
MILLGKFLHFHAKTSEVVVQGGREIIPCRVDGREKSVVCCLMSTAAIPQNLLNNSHD